MSRPPKLPRNVVVLSFASFFNDISSESVARALPIFLRESFRASFTAIGWIEGIADSLSIVLRLVTGWFVDGARRKKFFVAAGYGISAVARPFFPSAVGVFGWSGALALKVADRIGKAVRVVPRDALIAAESAPGTRGRGFGFNRALDTLGALIGIALVAVLVQGSPGNAEAPLTEGVFRLIVLAASATGFLAVLLVFFGVKEPSASRAGTVANPERPSGSLRDLPRGFVVYLVCVCLFTLAGSSDAFLLLKLRQAGFSLSATFWLIVGYNLLAAVTAYPVAKASDLVRRRKLPILIGWTIYAAAYALFACAGDRLWLLGGGFVAYGLYYGFVESAEKALVADLVPATHLGRAYGLFHFLTGALVLPANLIFGFISDRRGLDTALTAGAVIATVAILALLAAPVLTRQAMRHQ